MEVEPTSTLLQYLLALAAGRLAGRTTTCDLSCVQDETRGEERTRGDWWRAERLCQEFVD